jgi:DNA-binding MarR family transcriptional regulator
MNGDRPPLLAATGDDQERAAASDELGQSFKALLAAVRRLRGRETRRHGGLSNAQYGLLFGLCEHNELSSSELACIADLSPATATEMLEGLATAGLVRRERSERDRRVVLVSLTVRGRRLVEERRERLQPRWRDALAEFSDEELRTTAAVLKQLRAMFDELPEDA